jgi:hypothetical protein
MMSAHASVETSDPVKGAKESKIGYEMQPRADEVTMGHIKPATGPLKVQVQTPEAAEEILDFRPEQKKKKGRPHKASKEKELSQGIKPRAEDQPPLGP